MPATPAARPSRNDSYGRCSVCEHPDRTDIELAYMSGDRLYAFPFGRAAIERHMSHVTEPEALRIVLGLSAATALAARLRMLEASALQVLDKALDQEGDGALALKAIKEVRATIELTARVAGSLVDRVSVDSSRPDIDSAIEDALRARGAVPSAPRDEPAPSSDQGTRPYDRIPVMRALPPASDQGLAEHQ